MSEVTVKVERSLFPPGRPATVKTRFGMTTRLMHLTDDVRWQMGGERVAYFNAEEADGKITIKTRLPNQDW